MVLGCSCLCCLFSFVVLDVSFLFCVYCYFVGSGCLVCVLVDCCFEFVLCFVVCALWVCAFCGCLVCGFCALVCT